MPNEGNLTPFPPGVSGNKNGRPKGKSVSKCLEYYLSKKIKCPSNKLTSELKITNRTVELNDLVALSLIASAMAGSEKAAESIMNRTEGKVKETVEQKHSGEVTLKKRLLDD